MTERPLCRHYHPLQYIKHCGVGLRAPRDCVGCRRYDADHGAKDQERDAQWKKLHDRRPV